MAEILTCPPPEQLLALLEGRLSVDDQPALAEHIDQCTSCQAALESIRLSGQSWADVAPALVESAADSPVLQDVLERAKASGTSATTDGAHTEPAEAWSFLQSSDNADHLGRLDSYQILALIGKGGMGIVFRGFDEKLHRMVAIKVMAPQLATSAVARKRFTREARAAAAVSHDHVVPIYAVGDEGPLPYLVMQLVAGQSLQEKLDRVGPLGLREILRIGLQTAEGLAAAHKQGLVHRDIKPANILLENGVERVKLTDFGLARTRDDASVTQSGVIAGTPQFMAPEQAAGEAVDYRADLFSLGSVLYAMCAGRAPFRASNAMAVLKRVCDETPTPIQQINPDIPDWLAEIIVKLQSKKPSERFQSAQEVAELLGQHLAHLQQPGPARWVARPESSKGVASPDSSGTPFEDSGRATQAPARTWKVDDRVFAPWEEEWSYAARVREVKGDSVYVWFDDGEVAWVKAADLRPLDITAGSRVLGALHQSWVYYPGVVTERDGERVHIVYDHGDKEWTQLVYICVPSGKPAAAPSPPTPDDVARRQRRAAAWGLVLLTPVNLLIYTLVLIGLTTSRHPLLPWSNAEYEGAFLIVCGMLVLYLPLGGIMILGAMNLARQEPRFVRAAALLAMLPVHPAFPLGIPLGIWALSLLKTRTSPEPLSEGPSPSRRKSAANPAGQPPAMSADACQQALARLQTPAYGLGIAGILYWLSIPFLFFLRFKVLSGTDDDWPFLWRGVGLIPAVAGFVLIFAAWKMRRGEFYWFSVFAACLPFGLLLEKLITLNWSRFVMTMGDWIALPFGMWTLIVLTRRDVRTAFAEGSSRRVIPPESPALTGTQSKDTPPHRWWLRQTAFSRKVVKAVLLGLALVFAGPFFAHTGDGGPDGTTHHFGAFDPWLTFESTAHGWEYRLNLLSWPIASLLVAVVLFTIWRRLHLIEREVRSAAFARLPNGPQEVSEPKPVASQNWGMVGGFFLGVAVMVAFALATFVMVVLFGDRSGLAPVVIAPVQPQGAGQENNVIQPAPGAAKKEKRKPPPEPVKLGAFDPAKHKPAIPPAGGDAKLTLEDGSMRIESFRQFSSFDVKLFDLAVPLPANGVFSLRAKIKVRRAAKTENCRGFLKFLYPENADPAFKRPLGEAVPDTEDWQTVEVRYPVHLFWKTDPTVTPAALEFFGHGTIWIKDIELWHIPDPPPERREVKPGETVLKSFTFKDKPISSDYVNDPEGGWRLDVPKSKSGGTSVVRLFQHRVTDWQTVAPNVVPGRLIVRARVKTVKIGAVLRIYCVYPGGARGSGASVQVEGGSTNWTTYDTFFDITLPGIIPDVIEFTVGSDGGGTFWIKDVDFLHAPADAKANPGGEVVLKRVDPKEPPFTTGEFFQTETSENQWAFRSDQRSSRTVCLHVVVNPNVDGEQLTLRARLLGASDMGPGVCTGAYLQLVGHFTGGTVVASPKPTLLLKGKTSWQPFLETLTVPKGLKLERVEMNLIMFPNAGESAPLEYYVGIKDIELVKSPATGPPQPVVLKSFDPAKDKLVHGSFKVQEGGWVVEHEAIAEFPDVIRSAHVPLFRVADVTVPKTGQFIFRAKLKGTGAPYSTFRAKVGAALTMGPERSKSAATDGYRDVGSIDWATYEIVFPVSKFKNVGAAGIPLDLIVSGKGTTWIKDVELLYMPESSAGLEAKGTGKKKENE